MTILSGSVFDTNVLKIAMNMNEREITGYLTSALVKVGCNCIGRQISIQYRQISDRSAAVPFDSPVPAAEIRAKKDSKVLIEMIDHQKIIEILASELQANGFVVEPGSLNLHFSGRSEGSELCGHFVLLLPRSLRLWDLRQNHVNHYL